MSLVAKLVNKTFTYTKRENPAFTPNRSMYEVSIYSTDPKVWENWERMFFGTEPYSYGREELRNPFYWEFDD
jgi:hypothetical protein